MTQNILVLGGSRNIGYYASLRLLAAGCNVLFLLRSTAVFDNDAAIQEHIKAGRARLLKGDTLVKEDVNRAWEEAGKIGPVDVVLFTIGGIPSFHPLKGFVINPANLVTQSLLNVLTTMPTTGPQPKLIIHSSIGLTKIGHKALPLAIKPLYGWLLAVPHGDKLGAERLLSHCAGWDWTDPQKLSQECLPDGWEDTEGLPAPGTLKHVLVVRPALLTDGDCKADKERKNGKDGKDKPPYRVSEQELGGYMISRKDVAHFAADVILNKWEEFENKTVNVGY